MKEPEVVLTTSKKLLRCSICGDTRDRSITTYLPSPQVQVKRYRWRCVGQGTCGAWHTITGAPP